MSDPNEALLWAIFGTTDALDFWDNHTSDGRCKYPTTCEAEGTHTPKAVAPASGYDWLLNRCCDLDQAEHAAHLDEGQQLGDCGHCREGAGRRHAPSESS